MDDVSFLNISNDPTDAPVERCALASHKALHREKTLPERGRRGRRAKGAGAEQKGIKLLANTDKYTYINQGEREHTLSPLAGARCDATKISNGSK